MFGVGHRPTPGEPRYEWLEFDFRARKATAVKLDVPVPADRWKSLLIYGSLTRDDKGRYYVGGRYVTTTGRDRSVPAAWQIVP